MTQQKPPRGFRTFLILWGTQSFSAFGSALTLFACNIWLAQVLYPLPEQRADLALALAALNLTFVLPAVLVAPLAGAWVDRHDRKRTMLIADSLSGCLSFILVVLMIGGALQLWALLLILALFATFNTFHSLAFDTSYIALVPEPLLPRANGMMQTIWSLSSILAPAIAANIIALPALAQQGALTGALGDLLGRLHSGVPLAIAVDMLTFLVASAVLLFLHIPSPHRAQAGATGQAPRRSVWADVKAGALYIWRRRPLFWLLSVFTIANLLLSPVGILLQLLVKFNLAADWSAQGFTFETALALLTSAFGAGGVAGGLFVSAWGGLKTKRIYGVIVPMLMAGGALALLGLWPTLYVTIAMGFVASAMAPILNAHAQSIWQTQTPSELQGRVFSVRQMIGQVTMPLGIAIAGVLGGLLDPGVAMIGLGSILVVFCIVQLFSPYVQQVEVQQTAEAPAAPPGAGAGQLAVSTPDRQHPDTV